MSEQNSRQAGRRGGLANSLGNGQRPPLLNVYGHILTRFVRYLWYVIDSEAPDV